MCVFPLMGAQPSISEQHDEHQHQDGHEYQKTAQHNGVFYQSSDMHWELGVARRVRRLPDEVRDG